MIYFKNNICEIFIVYKCIIINYLIKIKGFLKYNFNNKLNKNFFQNLLNAKIIMINKTILFFNKVK